MLVDKTEQSRNEFRRVRNLVKTEIRKAKQVFFDKKLSKATISAEVFRVFNGFRGQTKKPMAIVNVEHFNNFFATIGSKLSEKFSRGFPKTNGKISRLIHTFRFFPVDASEISEVIDKLKSKRSVGHDGISSSTLKLIAPVISEKLADLFNESIAKHVFSECLKTAKVLPFHKSDDSKDPNNFQPISLLSQISKIFEKIIYKRMNNFISKHKLFSRSQFGFQKNKSCVDAILKPTETIRKTIDQQNFGLSCFVDSKKAKIGTVWV